MNNLVNIKEDHELLYKAYKVIHDSKKEKEHLEKYTSLSDSLSIIRKSNNEIPLKKLINDNQELTEKSKNNIYIIFSVITLFLFVFGIFFRKNYIQKNKEKETIIQEKEEENQNLKQKVNEPFEEVVQLAKTNSPEFFSRFREVYPDIIKKLLEIEPKFRVSELTLIAYVYLGFNTIHLNL